MTPRLPRSILSILVARRGHGKTTALKAVVKRLGRTTPILVADPAGEIAAMLKQEQAPLGDEGHVFAAELLVLAPPGGLVIIDDADGFLRAQARGPLQKAIAFSRNLDISVILAAKTSSEIPPWLAGNADMIAHGNFRGPSAVKWARDNTLDFETTVPRYSLMVEWPDNESRRIVRSENFAAELIRGANEE